MTTLIFGQQDDPQVLAVADALGDDNSTIIDDDTLLHDITVHYENGTAVCELDGNLLQPSSVYWRTLNYYPFESQYDQTGHNVYAYIDLFLKCFEGARMVNPLRPFIDHFIKYRQFDFVQSKTQVSTPATIITMNGEQAMAFLEKHGCAILKPVAGGDYAHLVYPDDDWTGFEFEQPVIFQEYIEGTDVRTYVVGDNVYSADIITDEVDFRTGDHAIVPTKLPKGYKKAAKDITQSLGYEWTAIDWINRNGELFFLEANFSPMFCGFEKATGFPIASDLAEILK